MGLNHYQINHKFLDTLYDDDPAVTAITETRWQYMTANIKWYLPSAIRSNPDQLIEVLVHELVHVALAPEQTLIDERLTQHNAENPMTEHEWGALQTAYYERLELATETITRMIINAYPPPKKR